MPDAPSYSCRLWTDRGAIYVEIASGLIFKFEEHELHKVIKLLQKESRPTERPSKTRLPKVPRTTRKDKPLVTIEERDRALAILKRRGDV
jgi:superfamily II helicase